MKKQVRELSEYKLNAFTLYTEHIFKLKKHPTIAPNDGISAEEIVELDNYCKKYHVQLIGNFQSFGHFANILRVPGYENLRETSDVLTPAKEESYQFLKDVYDEIAPAYSSSLFNINCDETYGLGEGPAKEMIAKEGLGNVYAKHINRVASLLSSHSKTPMMWGDIALQYPDIRKNLPKDLVVLTWGYDPRASFVDQIEPFTKIGFKFLVCPGVSCWGQNFPDLEAATTNISNFVRDGASHGALGMLNTTWDDTGENLFNNNWYPLIWGAEVSWKPTEAGIESQQITGSKAQLTDVENRRARIYDFNIAFSKLFYGMERGSISSALWQLSNLRKLSISAGHSDREFWKAPWQIEALEDKDKSIYNTVTNIYLSLLGSKRLATRNSETLDAALFATKKILYLYLQAKTKSELPEVMKLPSILREKVVHDATRDLDKAISSLSQMYKEAWFLENRPWWLDRNMSKFEQVKFNVANLGRIPIFDPPPGTLKGSTHLKISTVIDSKNIRYTLDGTNPTEISTQYYTPIKMTRSIQVKATNFADGKATPVMTGIYNIASRPCTFETKWDHYGENTNVLAFDGLLDTFFWSFGSVAADSTFGVIFDDPDMIASIKVTTGHPDHPEDYLHEGILEVSADGKKWREIAQFKNGIAETGMIGFRVKGIRIRVTKDNGNWLVIREIEIK